MPIHNLDIADFLANTWQKKPLLIRNAFPSFVSPLTPEDLAGLACEPEIESRLITETDGKWLTTHGPIAESKFNTLSNSHWTLLVQAVDHWVPEVADFLDNFRFIPSWRIDDVMVSYATRDGSVGPHYDNYDVFLVQGAGKRRWQVGGECSANSALQDNSELRLLANFVAEQEWVLETGDVLYIPPCISHWGTSVDNDCMTYSIGFRAPSHSEVLSDFCDHTLASLNEELRYRDAGLQQQSHAGEITLEAIEKAQKILQDYVGDKQRVADWFGSYVTQQKYPSEIFEDAENHIHQHDLIQLLENNAVIFRDPTARIAFVDSSSDNNSVSLFINGVCFESVGDSSNELSKVLADNTRIPSARILPLLKDTECLQLLLHLVNQGSLYFDDKIDN
jgi:50S ribosomal protein L16 3-hydroxylase